MLILLDALEVGEDEDAVDEEEEEEELEPHVPKVLWQPVAQ
jgi:hypothetical protein